MVVAHAATSLRPGDPSRLEVDSLLLGLVIPAGFD
jgi:hypothetical protein